MLGLVTLLMPTMHILGPNVQTRVFATDPLELAIASQDMKVLLVREPFAPITVMIEELVGQRKSWPQKLVVRILHLGTR